MPKWQNTDQYLATIDDPKKRAALEKLRAQIQKAAPEATECLSYGVPAFCFDGRPLVAYAAFAKHCGFYPLSPDVIAAHATDLTGFELAKGTIRFKPETPLKPTLVRRLVRARIAEIRG
jgi:uncharacterized protein YdhG (YjbR/CyaY superfamily)